MRHDGTPVPSLPHIEMTVACLREHGVEVDDTDATAGRSPPQPVRATDVTIEPDLSNAAPFLMLAHDQRRPGHRARAGRGRTTQAGDALRDLLARMGAEVDARRRRASPSPAAGPSRGIDADLHDVGELAPRRRRAVRAWPTARRGCAASPTSAATRPTG